MALVSPGIQVTVTDQSNYVPSANGTVPYILLATAENKSVPGGGVASGTLAENAGKLYAITSQRDLVNTFGTPVFQQTVSAAPINGSEINEYGLLAAYSALGVSNQVYVQRADVDLSELDGSTSRPAGEPADGTYWLDTDDTVPGMYSWNAVTETFTALQPLVDLENTNPRTAPSNTVGSVGDYLVKAAAVPMTTWYKQYDNTWVEAGTPTWKLAIPAVVGNKIEPVGTGGNIVINSTSIAITSGDTMADVVDLIDGAGISGVAARLLDGAIALSVSNISPLEVSGSALAEIGISAGSYYAPLVKHSSYFEQPQWMSFDDEPRPTGSLWIKTSHVGQGTNIAVNQYSATSNQWTKINVENYFSEADATYNTDPINGGLNIPSGTVWAKYNVYRSISDYEMPTWELWYRKNTGATNCVGLDIAVETTADSEFTIKVTQPTLSGYNADYTRLVEIPSGTTPSEFLTAISTLAIPNVTVSLDADGKITISHARGGDILLENVSGDALESMGLSYNVVGGEVNSATNFYSVGRDQENSFVVSNWAPLSELGYLVAETRPYAAPSDGELWYWNSPTKVDIMVNDGTNWVGYRTLSRDIRGYNLTQTDVNGVQVQTVAPTTKSDGSVLSNGDLWLDSSDLENFPRLYRYQSVSGVQQWVLIDTADNISQNGIIFADARWATSGDVDPAFGTIPSARALAASSYTDLDAPNAALYPRGILLFNTRASSYNVKKYVENYFTDAAYPNLGDGEELPEVSSTWVSVSGTQVGGTVPAFGRHAQRGVVISALKSAIDSSTAIREEQNAFNIVACPGYPELIPNMIALNNDRNNTGFVIGDTPMRLPATGTDIIEWANNSQLQTQTNEKGLVNHDPYLAVYYPSCITNDLSGNAVVVPASHAMIRTMIRSDNASYPWFPAAGTRRGLLDNVSAVGYIDPASGTFVSIGVTQGLRDTLYANQINPLTYLQGAGLVCYGNKTTVSTPSALDRINVARLINYIRQQLDRLARPYIFEPNDPLTRSQIKSVTESLLNDIVSKRGITDYLVVCDSSNNTADRIARNELYVDVAIQPTKDVEFIYIPIRLKNPGELESGNVSSSLTVGTGA